MAGSLKVWDGAAWQYVQLPQGGAIVQPGQPTAPTVGQLWYDTDDTVPGGDFGGDTGWIAPTLLNGWVNYGVGWDTVAYRRKNGIVYLKGLMKSGTINTFAFQLPAGFRPSAMLLFAPGSNNAGTVNLTRLDIDASGNVNPQAGTNVAYSLSGVSFVADN